MIYRIFSATIAAALIGAPAFAQAASPFSSTSGGVGGSGSGSSAIGSFGQSSPLRPLRPFYPRAQVQNPSNPWLPPNLGQVNTNLSPVGSISPTGTLSQPTSVLNTPGTVQQAGFPTVPNYNIGTATPTTQSISIGGGGSSAASISNSSNPGGQGSSSITNLNSVGRNNPTNPLFP